MKKTRDILYSLLRLRSEHYCICDFFVVMIGGPVHLLRITAEHNMLAAAQSLYTITLIWQNFWNS